MVNGFRDVTVSLHSLQRESQETNKWGIGFRLDLTALNVLLHNLKTGSSDAPALCLLVLSLLEELGKEEESTVSHHHPGPYMGHTHPFSVGSTVQQEGLSRYWGCHCTGGLCVL